MAKVTPRGKAAERDVIVVRTSTGKKEGKQAWSWWKAKSKAELTEQVLDTVAFLKQQEMWRYRQAGLHSRMYGNLPIFTGAGAMLNRLPTGPNALPLDRPTMNVVQSVIDTKVSRISQARPRPVFLTDNGDYKQRNMAKKLNAFAVGELYRTKAYRMGELILRDAEVLGTGVLKVYRTPDNKVGLDRVLPMELLVDANEAYYGDPRQIFQLKLIDRAVLAEMFPEHRSQIEKAEQGYPDQGADGQKTASDQVIVAEGWHLPSGPDAGDGRHVIVCTSGVILDEDYKKPKFPFVVLLDSPRIVGFFGQGAAERLMGTQVEINKLLVTISQSINLVGVPRVFVEMGSKVVKAHLNNQVGSIVTYQGTKPSYEVAPCVPAEVYAQLQRLIEFAYQQEGVSQLAAASVKPAGLNSGEAQRAYQENQTDRLAALSKRYDNVFVELAYAILDVACDIQKDTGSYSTIFPDKHGTKSIELPEIKELTEDTFVIQCFDASSLPRDPAGRLQKVTEMMQAGIITPQEGRRLLDYPDIQQVDKLANSGEERILQILDEIVEEGKFTPPDPFMDLGLAAQLATQYYNLYSSSKLEEDRAQMLRDFFTQTLALQNQAQQPAPEAAPPMASPEALPTNPMLPNVPGAMPA